MPAQAKRVALLIGNDSYEHTTSLANATSDTRLIESSAKKAGFDDVVIANDLAAQPFQDALRKFRQLATGADVAMIYYAGHGIEARGKNWLIPTDAQLRAAYDLPYEAIDLDLVLDTLDGAQMRVVVLDACRNNPFGRSWQAKTRSLGRGLSGVEVDDVLVIYAAAPGQVAEDGEDGNSPFAKSFAQRLPQPGLPIQLLGGVVRDDVLAATMGHQRPYVSASVTGTPVYLVAAPSTNIPKVQVSNIAALNESDLDRRAWETALVADNMAAYRSYLDQFPAGNFAETASENIARLSGKNVQKGTGFIPTALPQEDSVDAGDPLPIDGIWRVSSNGKRVRIEGGRAIALDPWTQMFVFTVSPGQVTMTDIVRDAPGEYSGKDILVPGAAKMALAKDGNLDVTVQTGLFPITFRLIGQTLRDAEGFAAEQALAE